MSMHHNGTDWSHFISNKFSRTIIIASKIKYEPRIENLPEIDSNYVHNVVSLGKVKS